MARQSTTRHPLTSNKALSQLCVGCLLPGMGVSLSVVCIPTQGPLEKTNVPLGEVITWKQLLGEDGPCAYFPFQCQDRSPSFQFLPPCLLLFTPPTPPASPPPTPSPTTMGFYSLKSWKAKRNSSWFPFAHRQFIIATEEILTGAAWEREKRQQAQTA